MLNYSNVCEIALLKLTDKKINIFSWLAGNIVLGVGKAAQSWYYPALAILNQEENI